MKSWLIAYLCMGLGIETGDRGWYIGAGLWLAAALLETALWVYDRRAS